MLLCHNTMFDGSVLAWTLQISPQKYLDTLCMARALHGVDAGGSLKVLAERYQIGVKGEEVIHAKGKRKADFTPEELARYGEYCINDVELTYKLFGCMAPRFPESELDLINLTLRMFIHPVFTVDENLLLERLDDVRAEKSELLSSLKEKLGCNTEEEVRKKLASNKQFAELLKSFGVEPPIKESPTTGKPTFALAKNDEGFIALTEHEDPFIQQLCAVRLGTKSTIEESRIERFIDIGKRNQRRLPIPLKYYGAHTGRWAGQDKVNFQNLPSRDKKKKTLKNAVVPHEGYVVINSDSSQIEARILAWLAGQTDVVDAFAQGRDVYSEFATKVYGRPISKENPIERFVGKTCIAEGTLVLSDLGWKPIEQISLSDKLWDGQEWVCHQGLLNNGIKPTLNLCGIWLTPDHKVWSGTQWLEAQSVIADENILSQALDIGAVNLPFQAMCAAKNSESKHSSSNVTATTSNIQLTNITSKILKALGVRFVQRKPLAPSDIGFILKQWLTMPTEQDYLTDCPLPLAVAITQTPNTINTMESGVSTSMKVGERIKRLSSNTFKNLMGGTNQSSKWTELTSTVTTSQGTLDSCQEVITYETNEKSLISKNVFDILNCGSRNRFTVLTDSGPIIVHNCILGLGYGTGAAKLQHTLKTQPPGAVVDDDEAKRIVDLYRSENDKIIDLWAECDDFLGELISWPKNKKDYYIGVHDCVTACPEGLLLPNGFYLHYPEITRDTSEAKSRIVYKSRKGPVSVWGGSIVENIVQALARCVIGEQMLLISKKYRPALTVHDAVVVVVEEDELEEALAYVIECMNTRPSWAPGLPITCEAKYGLSYGACG